MDDDQELLQEFLAESNEFVLSLDQDLIELEDKPEDGEILANAFRTLHSIKGSAGFMALPKLEQIAHQGESLLGAIRDKKRPMNRDVSDSLFSIVDAIRSILVSLEKNGVEGNAEVQDSSTSVESPATGNKDRISHTATESEAIDEDDSVEQPADALLSRQAETTVRIDVEALDKLMNLVGELVLARNQIQQVSCENRDPQLAAAAQRLDQITGELQASVINTRMRPIRHAWNSLPRVARDLASGLQKQVAVEFEGAETELDKTILESIKDPLIHIVRNAVDHGIELPSVRKKNGKPDKATVLLRAFHEAGMVNVEVSDDGQGIDLEQVRKRAIDRHLLNRTEVDRLSNHELTQLILMPGFSTAEKVTNVSGRGVGMDVVKNNVEAIGGTIEIESVAGASTTIRLKIPLTLAIVPALIVSSNKRRFAIPQVNLQELVRLEGAELKKNLEFLRGFPVCRLRDQLLPLLYLDEELKTRDARTMAEKQQAAEMNIVVLRTENRTFGLIVDDVNDTQEVVVKPLGPILCGIPVYTGATVMGDGSISLILDVAGLALNRIPTEHEPSEAQTSTPTVSLKKKSWLVVRSIDGQRQALDLSVVTRLEELPANQIDFHQESPVVKYRGNAIPVVADRLCREGCRNDERAFVLVICQHAEQSIGVVAEDILDIVETTEESESDTATSDIQVINDSTTEIIRIDRELERRSLKRKVG